MKFNVLKNIFQFSTLRALAVVLSAFGLTVPEPVVSSLSVVGLTIYGAWETFRDGSKGKNAEPQKAGP